MPKATTVSRRAHVPPQRFPFSAGPARSPGSPLPDPSTVIILHYVARADNTRQPAEHWLIGKGRRGTCRRRRLSRGGPTYPPRRFPFSAGIPPSDPSTVIILHYVARADNTRQPAEHWLIGKGRGGTSRKRGLSRGWPTYPPTNFHFRPARGDPRKSPDLPSKSLDCRVIGNGLVRAEGDNCLEEGPRTPPEISIFGGPARSPQIPRRELAAISGPCLLQGSFLMLLYRGERHLRQPTATRHDQGSAAALGPRQGHPRQSASAAARMPATRQYQDSGAKANTSGQLWVHHRGIRGSRHRRECLQRDNTRIREQRPTRAASSGSTTGASEAVGIGENACNETIPGFGAKANTSGQLWVHHRRIRGSRHRRHKGCLQLDTTRVRELRPRTRIGVGAGSCGFDCRVSRPSSRHWRWQEVPENQYGPGRAT